MKPQYANILKAGALPVLIAAIAFAAVFIQQTESRNIKQDIRKIDTACAATATLIAGAQQPAKDDSTSDAIKSSGGAVYDGDALADESVQEHVINLPEDGGAFYLTIFTNDNPQQHGRDWQLLAWMQQQPELAKLKAQTHFNHYTPSNKLYASRFANYVPSQAFPAIMLQGNSAAGEPGKVYYKASAATLPRTPQELVKQIRAALGRGPCPSPSPNPTPGPTPGPGPAPLIPDIGPPDATPPDEVPDEEGEDNVLLLALLAALAAGAVTGIAQFKSRTAI